MIAPDSLSAALEFQRGTIELVVEHATPIDRGWVFRDRSLPLVWLLNAVRVSGPIDYREALALADEHLRDLTYRQLVLDHEPSARRLEPAFRGDGWEVDQEVTMVLAGPPDRAPAAFEVIEPGEQESLALMGRWLSEDPTLRLTAEGLRQLGEFNRRAWSARRARRLGVRGADGELVAIANLFSDGRTAQVEDVYTVPEARGRGAARALVSRAIALAQEAGHELVFIVADDNDWPKHLYQRLGFQPAGRAWLLHQRV